MTSLTPRAPYSDAELADLYPPQLRLQLVQIFLRHGERTPVKERFANAGLPRHWSYCSAANHLRSVLFDPRDANKPGAGDGTANSFSTLQWKRHLETLGANDAAVPVADVKGQRDGICELGMLTDRGRETCLHLGQRLRRLYVDQLHFLPPTINSSDFLYLRSTGIPRALESMQQAFQGLYPSATRDPNMAPPALVTRAFPDETLFPNDFNCRRLSALTKAFAQRAADRWNDTPEMAHLNKRIGKWMPEDSPRVAVDSRPRLVGILDSVNSTLAHGPETRLPKEFYEPRVREITDKVCVEEWFEGYKESNEYRTLGIGGLLGDVVARMVGTAEERKGHGETDLPGPGPHRTAGPSPVRFALNGCHDTTLAATLASLGAFEGGSWPPYTSHLAVELFRHIDGPESSGASSPGTTSGSSSWLPAFLGGSSAIHHAPGMNRKPIDKLTTEERQRLRGYYVRIRYNDSPVTLPGCKAPGKHLQGDESFCTLDAFKSIVDKFTPKDWKQQCLVDPKAPAIPTKIEPAGY